jgi:hypothetical protein
MNYQNILDDTIKNLNGEKKKLLLHVCCGPCSSYVLEYLNNYFDITIYYYNPNIDTKDEFDKRTDEVNRLVKEAPFAKGVEVVVAPYEKELFDELSKGLEDEPEGGARCKKCYYLRLRKTALYAKENHYDYFTTTLSISPYKDADALNNIGKKLSEELDINYLYSDFKKKNGYKRSIELSHIYNLYRQDYCGCVYSKLERVNYVKSKKSNNR